MGEGGSNGGVVHITLEDKGLVLGLYKANMMELGGHGSGESKQGARGGGNEK